MGSLKFASSISITPWHFRQRHHCIRINNRMRGVVLSVQPRGRFNPDAALAFSQADRMDRQLYRNTVLVPDIHVFPQA